MMIGELCTPCVKMETRNVAEYLISNYDQLNVESISIVIYETLHEGIRDTLILKSDGTVGWIYSRWLNYHT